MIVVSFGEGFKRVRFQQGRIRGLGLEDFWLGRWSFWIRFGSLVGVWVAGMEQTVDSG